VQDLFYEGGLSKEDVEAHLIEYFRRFDSKANKKIDSTKRRIFNLRKENYTRKSSQAHDISEKAEVENLSLESAEEIKKEISKQASTRLAA
jgi:adenylosuccinate synthase